MYVHPRTKTGSSHGNPLNSPKVLSLLLILFCLSLGFFVLSGCNSTTETSIPPSPNPESQLQVVTTIFPLGDITQNLGGNKVQVLNLLPTGASPHTYEPTPEQMKSVANAQLILSIGADLDNWVQKLATTVNPQAQNFILANSLTLLNIPEQNLDQRLSAGEDGEDNDHEHHGADPHVWLDPIRVRDEIAPQITQALIQLDPANTAYYQENLQTYQQSLSQLDQEYSRALAQISHRRFISFHDSWRYLAQRYNLEIVAAVEPASGQEPSGQWVAALVNLARAQEVKVIFAEPQFNSTIPQVITQEFGGKVYILDPLGGADIEGRSSYLQLMTYNLDILHTALAL